MNRRTRFCRPLPNHSAMSPVKIFVRPTGISKRDPNGRTAKALLSQLLYKPVGHRKLNNCFRNSQNIKYISVRPTGISKRDPNGRTAKALLSQLLCRPVGHQNLNNCFMYSQNIKYISVRPTGIEPRKHCFRNCYADLLGTRS